MIIAKLSAKILFIKYGDFSYNNSTTYYLLTAEMLLLLFQPKEDGSKSNIYIISRKLCGEMLRQIILNSVREDCLFAHYLLSFTGFNILGILHTYLPGVVAFYRRRRAIICRIVCVFVYASFFRAFADYSKICNRIVN